METRSLHPGHEAVTAAVPCLQFQEAAQQRDADDIADVLDVQAADAEDAKDDEDPEQADADEDEDASFRDTDVQGGVLPQTGLKAAATTVKDAASDAATGLGQAAKAGAKPLTDSKAAGATEDVHEADLDLSHADNPPDVKTTGDTDAKEADLDLSHSDKAPVITQADAAKVAKEADLNLSRAENAPVIRAAGATKDLHEADVDLSHTDKAPGTSCRWLISWIVQLSLNAVRASSASTYTTYPI